MKENLMLIIFVFSQFVGLSQKEDSIQIRKIFNEALANGHSYNNLRSLCKDVGNRISGSEGAQKAVEWGNELMKNYDFDSVWLQPIMVPKWYRGATEKLAIITPINQEIEVLALGGSVGTNGNLEAPLIIIESLEKLEETPSEMVKGKIVLLNKGFDPTTINAFEAYGPCATQRFNGASAAAKKGAVACLVRSAASPTDDFPHTGSMRYEDGIEKIPTAAISTSKADLLEALSKGNQNIKLALNLTCKDFGMVPSYNVIGEIKGSENPENIIVVGGHLDSWDVGEGAHDDGAGVIHSIEVLRIYKELGIKPKNTVRCILFMNEENGNNGGKSYAEFAKKSGEKHIAAIESDRGGFVPRGFSFDAQNYHLMNARKWENLLKPYNIHIWEKGYGGVDIGPLKNDKIALIGFVPDPQRYFDFHHTEDDVFENVHKRELELGCASIASLIYLIDKYGLGEETP